MAKKSDKNSSSKNGKTSLFSYIWKIGIAAFALKWIFVIVVVLATLYISTSHPQALISIKNRIDAFTSRFMMKESTVVTFEMKYNEDEITSFVLKKLPSEKYNIGQTRLLYSPCLLVDVKHIGGSGKSTEESSMVWDLMDGELFISLDTFQATSGFRDCLTSQANLDDFRMLHLLSEEGGMLTKEKLIRLSGIDDDTASSVIESLRKRHLVTIQHDLVRLHVKNPFFSVEPSTSITKPFVQKTIPTVNMVTESFSRKSIEKLIQHAYGKDVAILDSEFVWIPIWEVDINNPDGSTRRTFWNGLSGKEIVGKSAQALKNHALQDA